MTGSTVSFRVTVRRESVVTFRGHLRSSRWDGKGQSVIIDSFSKKRIQNFGIAASI